MYGYTDNNSTHRNRSKRCKKNEKDTTGIYFVYLVKKEKQLYSEYRT